MANRTVSPLNEDFEALGLTGKEGRIGALAGLVEDDEADGNGGGTQQTEGNDPFDGPFVSKELFERIKALPFDAMEEDDYQELLDALKEKQLPEGDEELRQMAEEVATDLVERFRKLRRAGKLVAKKVKVGTAAARRKLRMAYKKARHHISRLRERRGKKGRTKKLGRITKLFRKRQQSDVDDTALASELASLLEGAVEENTEVDERLDAMERICRIFGLVEGMLENDAVTAVLDEAYESMHVLNESSEGEEGMTDEEFADGLKPYLKIIARSIEAIDEDFDLPDDLDDEDPDVEDSEGN